MIDPESRAVEAEPIRALEDKIATSALGLEGMVGLSIPERHPIVGDSVYGGVHRRVPGDIRAVLRLERPFLHAARLAFTHPTPHEWQVPSHRGTVQVAYRVFGDRVDREACTYTNINVNSPLVYDERMLDALVASEGEPDLVQISGGEPTTRNDLVDIAPLMIDKFPKLRKLTLNTTGITHHRAIPMLTKIVQLCNERNVIFSTRVSIDGVNDMHGQVRNVRNAFEKAGKTIAAMKELQKTHRFNFGISSTIFSQNLEDADNILAWAKKEQLDIVFNMVRRETGLCVPGNHDMKLLRKLGGKDVKVTHGLAETLAEIRALSEQRARLMAQAAGLIMLRRGAADEAPKVVFFMSADKVKFRKAVTPGDTLEIRAKLTKVRGRIAAADCECLVNSEVVSSAELLFTIADSPGG